MTAPRTLSHERAPEVNEPPLSRVWVPAGTDPYWRDLITRIGIHVVSGDAPSAGEFGFVPPEANLDPEVIRRAFAAG